MEWKERKIMIGCFVAQSPNTLSPKTVPHPPPLSLNCQIQFGPPSNHIELDQT